MAVWQGSAAESSRLLARDGQPQPAPLLGDYITSKPPWATYSTSWATTSVGDPSSPPSSRALTNLFGLAGEPGAPRQPDRAAACGRAGFGGLSGSGLMPCLPCVLPRPGTFCRMPVCGCVAIVCQYFVVLVGRCVRVPLVRRPDPDAAAVQCCGWSQWQASRPMSWWGGSCALWACGMTWGGRIASRLCPTRVRVRTSSREKNRGYAWSVVRVKVPECYKCHLVVSSYPLGDSLRVGTLWVAHYDQMKK